MNEYTIRIGRRAYSVKSIEEASAVYAAARNEAKDWNKFPDGILRSSRYSQTYTVYSTGWVSFRTRKIRRPVFIPAAA